MIAEGTLFIVKTLEGTYVMAEATNYTYLNLETARAFARDKWGQPEPLIANEVTLLDWLFEFGKSKKDEIEPLDDSDSTGFK
jgi:hypothetical protein